MAAHICVTLSGPALSFLIYENVKCYCDQEGFLVGEIISHVTDTISDSQIRGEKTETIISVNSLMPIPSCLSFYNGVGKINEEKLKSFLKDKSKEVIGWYSFRRNSSLVPHLRDRLLHKELSAAVPHVSPEHFTMCLLNTSISNGGSTHVFNHKFLRYRHSKFEALPMQIHNLGETQPEYKIVPSTTSLSESFNNIIASLKVSHESGSDAALVCHIQRALQEHLRRLINDVAQSEIRVAELEKEVDMLRQQPGPMPNEVLLPQLLREDLNDTNKLESSESDEPPILTPSKPIKRSQSPTTDICSNHIENRVEEGGGGGGDVSSSNEPFAYVTEMKAQMSQPHSSQPSSSIAVEGTSAVKRPIERGRGSGRGVGRVTRKTQQQQQKQQQQTSLQQQPQKQSSPKPGDNSESAAAAASRRSGSAGASPVRGGTTASNARGPKRCGYAQAVKRAGANAESPKPVTRSQTANTSSQEY
ncbi:hypothetical protein R5R35_014323 [Gryllus longicercus]|uniref:BRISC complex subunit FAM175B helical domain-containing protein n=1 Tax=Gryllus longicercus TaxID=2509291 RepID=A0AAN9VCP6_9ORTH